MSMPESPSTPAKVFYSYSHSDERLRNKLGKHLANLSSQGLITEWYDRMIVAGEKWAHEIDEHINSAHIILLLISSDFMASEYCNGIELKRAMARHETREARVVPILLREVDWEGAPFSKLQALPSNGKPIASWTNRDKAFEDVAKGLRNVIEDMTSAPPRALVNPEHERSPEKKVQWVMVLSATIDEVDRPMAEAVVRHLQRLTGDANLTLLRIEQGSVRLILESSKLVYKEIKEKVESAELTTTLGIDIERVYHAEQILLLINNRDRTLALDLVNYLLERAVDLRILDEFTIGELEEALREVRCVIVFYGSVDKRWVSRMLEQVLYVLLEKNYTVKQLGVYIAPPAKDLSNLIGFKAATLLSTPAQLDSFLTADPDL